jgi:hypothetical protein
VHAELRKFYFEVHYFTASHVVLSVNSVRARTPFSIEELPELVQSAASCFKCCSSRESLSSRGDKWGGFEQTRHWRFAPTFFYFHEDVVRGAATKKKVSIDNKKRVFVMTKKQRGSFKKIVRKLRFLCDYENITDFFLRRVFSLEMLETSPVNVI